MTGENPTNAADSDADETPVSARADFLSALVWSAFGLVIITASWRMDRLESQGAKLYTAPGLYPGILGGAILLLGLTLGWRAWRLQGHKLGATGWRLAVPARAALLRVGGCLVLGLAYAGGAVGRAGIPFWLATFIFVAAFILIFDWRERQQRNQTARGVALAVAMGAGTAFLVTYVFQEWFLVRLP